YLGKIARGDLGMSIKSQGAKVSDIIVAFLPWTIFCVGFSLLTSFILGIALGALMAYWRDSVLDYALTMIGSLLHSIPNYLIAMILIIFLGVRWELLPIVKMRGSMSPGMQPGFTVAFVMDVLFHAVLPIITYVVTTVGTWMLTMKASTTATLEEDYVNFACGAKCRAAIVYPVHSEYRVRLWRISPHRVDLRVPRDWPDPGNSGERSGLPRDAGLLSDHHGFGSVRKPARRLVVRIH
ncbi:MAG: ABC transporter permease, partial [Chloroflexi bacterium]|nr:ABC transporter permease [Chloroflexota bacterium]